MSLYKCGKILFFHEHNPIILKQQKRKSSKSKSTVPSSLKSCKIAMKFGQSKLELSFEMKNTNNVP